MDDNSFISNGLSALAGSQPHYSSQQPGHPVRRFAEGPQESNTLPPINGVSNMQQFPTMNQSQPGSVPGSMPQTPITPHTPIPSASSAPPDPNAFQQIHAVTAPARTLQPPPSSYPPAVTNYSSSQPMTTAPPSTLAPPQSFGHNQLLPRMPQPYPPQLLAAQQGFGRQPDVEQPTHVVGQQGRRGILPSAPGRAVPVSGKTAIPAKDADGKFPCPHCTKTYLHAKHLKRHMLRHTGDRPYQCKLCKDTFSRSDILKRHFQKCSIRRGVTGDTNHLEGSRNHLQRNRLSTGSIGEQHNYLNGAPPPASNPAYDQISNNIMNSLPNFAQEQPMFSDGLHALSNRSSRSNSLIRPDFNNQSTMAGIAHGLPAFSMPSSAPYGYAPAVTAGELNGSQQVRNGDSNGMLRQEQELGWPGNYPPNGTDGFMFASN